MDTDRNLLFGVLALHADFIGPTQLVDACTVWAARKDRPLAELLQDRGWITPRDRSHVEYLVERRLKKYGGNVRSSLASAADAAVRQSLATIRDRELQRSLADLPPQSSPSSAVPSAPRGRERFTLAHLQELDALGQIWIARDEELGRDVALKELRAELADSPAARERFVSAARLSGQLEHPNIRPLYELAQNSTTGLPFCTLRHVQGRLLTEAIQAYHERRRQGTAGLLEQRQLLQAFISICQAVSFAHARQIIHRDLRPNAIVLGDHGEAVLTDWNHAQRVGEQQAVVDRQLGDARREPRSTNGVSNAGNPTVSIPITPYQAPEQAAGRSSEVDQVSDVYSLGAILYEILVGEPPFAGDESQLAHRIQNEVPRPPRQRVPSTQRGLEAICMKAMAQRREDRYAKVGELVLDLECWLADEPLLAVKESALRSAGRWLRRHRALLSSLYVGAAILMLCLAGAVLTLNRARQGANQERELALQQKSRMEQQLLRSRRAIDQFVERVSSEPLLQEGDLAATKRNLLDPAVSFHLDSTYVPGSESAHRAEQAEATARLAGVHAAMGDADKAVSAYAEAKEALTQIVRDQPRNHAAGLSLAVIESEMALQLQRLGQSEQAEELLRDAVRIYDYLPPSAFNSKEKRRELARHLAALGELLSAKASLLEAEENYRRAYDILEAILQASPDDVDTMRDLARTLNRLASLLPRRGKLTEAENLHRQAVALGETVAARDQGFRHDLARSGRELADFLTQSGRSAEAVEPLRQAQAVATQLVRAYPGIPSYRRTLTAIHADLGHVLFALGKYDAAEAEYREALQLHQRLRADYPLVSSQGLDHARSLLGMGQVYRAQGKLDAALLRYREAIDTLTEVLGRERQQGTVAAVQAEVLRQMARALAANGNPREAGRELKRATELDPSTTLLTQAVQVEVLAREGHLDAALKLAKEVTAEGIASTDVLLGVLRSLGRVLPSVSKQDQPGVAGQAIEVLQKLYEKLSSKAEPAWQAVAIDPDFASLRALKRYTELEDQLKPLPQSNTSRP